MTSHENMSPQINHDIGLGLLAKEQSKSCNDRTIDCGLEKKQKESTIYFTMQEQCFFGECV
jgi:hypothetical protein